jgi:hypothetical protein
VFYLYIYSLFSEAKMDFNFFVSADADAMLGMTVLIIS